MNSSAQYENITYYWDFGDGSPHSSEQNPAHTYAEPGTYTWTLRVTVDDQTYQRTGTITILSSNPPQIAVNRSQLNFGSISGITTNPQNFLVRNNGAGNLDWYIADNASWLDCAPFSGLNSGVITVSVDPTGLSEGIYTAKIQIKDPNAPNSPQTIDVTLTVIDPSFSSAPFGSIDTPEDGTSGITGAMPVAGWVLDDVEVDRVEIWRAPVGEEPTAANGLVYIGDAILIEGARQDVEELYPEYPFNYKAGWGYMMLTYGLPNQGNGTCTIYAVAYDKEGNIADLGFKTITCDNANAVKPFGTIDTPTQGGEASGDSFVNFGWALTPMPNQIPEDGSTITVWIDGEEAGNPVYNQYRSDVAELFSGYENSEGAVGYYFIDTTQYENGVHVIAWSVVDSVGNTDDIGTRYFKVVNTEAAGILKTRVTEKRVSLDIPSSTESVLSLAPSFRPVYLKRGPKREREPEIVEPDPYGVINVSIREVERIEVEIGEGGDYTGYLLVGGELRPLPIGSTLDSERGIFSWQPGPGFIGNYQFVFINKDENTMTKVKTRILPKYFKKIKNGS